MMCADIAEIAKKPVVFCRDMVDGDWDLSPSETTRLVDFLLSTQGRSVGQVCALTTGSGHRRHHDMPTSKLSKSARARLVELFGPDNVPDTLFRFRIDSPTRLWCFRDGNVFHLLWWDRDHTVYRSPRMNSLGVRC